MAKLYDFRFNAQRAEFSTDGGVGVHYGPEATLATERRQLPFPQALAYLAEFSAKTPGPHRAFLSMAQQSDRVPPGFARDTDKRRIDKPGTGSGQ